MMTNYSSAYNGVCTAGTRRDGAFLYQPSANDTNDFSVITDSSYVYMLPRRNLTDDILFTNYKFTNMQNTAQTKCQTGLHCLRIN